MKRAKLRNLIEAHFNQEELKTLCFDLKIDYDSLSGDNKSAKTRELIQLCQREKRIDELLQYCRTTRPNVEWPEKLEGEVSYQFSTRNFWIVGSVVIFTISFSCLIVAVFSGIFQDVFSRADTPTLESTYITITPTSSTVSTLPTIPSLSSTPMDTPADTHTTIVTDHRTDYTFLDFEGNYDCLLIKGEDTRGVLREINAYNGKALELTYDLGDTTGTWVQIRCNFEPPLDLSAYDHLRFDWYGSSGAENSLGVGLINSLDKEYIFARTYHHITHQTWLGQIITPFKFLYPWENGTNFDPSRVSGFFVSVVNDPIEDSGGEGSITIDNLNAINVASRVVPADFETVKGNIVAANAAVNWLINQQTSTGLLKSWEEEPSCNAALYDQAHALMIFAHRGMWVEANQLLDALVSLQDEDGTWANNYNCTTLEKLTDNRWEGSIAWMVYALNYYDKLGGTHPQAMISAQRGADWLVTRISQDNGCLRIDHTEGTIVTWWALWSSGEKYANNANGLTTCLLTRYWDEGLGSFKGGQDWSQPYLDSQTLGAAFLKAIGEDEKARSALGYAREILLLKAQGGKIFLLPAQSGQLTGLSGQAGSSVVWNEGVAQYIAVGGEGANDLLTELLAQQRPNGALPGSPDEFIGSNSWATTWGGISPTAWLFFALCGEPFHPPVGGGC